MLSGLVSCRDNRQLGLPIQLGLAILAVPVSTQENRLIRIRRKLTSSPLAAGLETPILDPRELGTLSACTDERPSSLSRVTNREFAPKPGLRPPLFQAH